jgi:Na+/melibiose symporter-like transporter
MRSILADRRARLYLLGQAFSALGDAALWLAMGLWVKMLTGSLSAAGITFLMLGLGTMFAPLGGWLADSTRPRSLLIVTNLLSAAGVLLLCLVHDAGQVWLVYVVMLGYGVSASFLAPAEAALIKETLHEDLLADANSILLITQQGVRLVAPALGAGLFAVLGPAPVIVADSITFLVAAIVLVKLPSGARDRSPRSQRRFADITSGARHIIRSDALRRATAAAGAAMMGYGMSQTLLLAVTSQGLRRADAFVGILVSAQGLGAIVAGAVAPSLARRLGEFSLVVLALASAALGFLLQVVPLVPTVLVGAALVGASSAWIGIGLMTLLQRSTPLGLIGRADAALGVALLVPQTLAMGLAATAVAIVDYRLLLVAMAALTGGAATCLLADPRSSRGLASQAPVPGAAEPAPRFTGSKQSPNEV